MKRLPRKKPRSLETHYASAKSRIAGQLARSGAGYLQVGLSSLHRERKSASPLIEPAIGNLATAIELMLKAFLAGMSLTLVFRDLPLELRVVSSCPEHTSADSFNWRQLDNTLRSSEYKTVELDELIASFYLFFSNEKQVLGPYFRLLAKCRNAAIHLSLPSFRRYELERTAYLALSVFRVLLQDERMLYLPYLLTKDDEQFLKEYDTERIERVRCKTEQARETAKKGVFASVWSESWHAYSTKCPICGCTGLLTGDTQVEADSDEEGVEYACLVFVADAFACEACGLTLDDVQELRLAGMDVSYDRQNDVDAWLEDN